MEVTALCIRLLINVLILLAAEDQHCYCAEKTYAAFLHIVPNRLQLFEYESISFDCEGFDNFTEWRLRRRLLGVKTICGRYRETSKGSCVIKDAFTSDSGEYWCEAKGRERSISVVISVTAGSVILESPALPVMEGENVTLRCRTKKSSFYRVADFYKDGIITQTGSDGIMTIHNVSKSDEGLYKCNITGVGESAESWLAVGAGSAITDSPALPVMETDGFTLRCRNENTSNLNADFYKDVLLIRNSSTGGMTVCNISKSDEGHYKCNTIGVRESAESWLAFGAGSAISDSPALPVMETDGFTLSCKNENTSKLKADFYKDTLLIRNSSTGVMTIYNISKSDEGHYKCNTIGIGESAETWLAVRAYQEENLHPDVHSSRVFVLLWTIVTVLLVSLLLLLVVGLYDIKHKDLDESLTTIAFYTLSMGPEESYCDSSSLHQYQPAFK